MKHCKERIPPFRDLSGTDRWCLIWYHLFINNELVWRLSSLAFKVKCRLLGIECGRVRCYGRVDAYRAPGSRIALGDGVSVTSLSSRGNACSLYARARLRTLTPLASISIGEGTGINGLSATVRSTAIVIGKNCRIGPNVMITDSDCHAIMPPEARKSSPGFESDAEVNIEENVWVGMNSMILKGVRIGKNSVIGAGSIVTRDIPSDCLAVGAPAKEKKKLK